MERTQARRARFGAFELDLHAGELNANGECTLLPEQVFQVLRLLAERRGDVVSRDELKKELWPNDTVVEFDHGINGTIKRLRKALDDSADEPRYIETIPRRGYRLMVPVEWVRLPEDGAEDSSDDVSSPESSEPAIDDADAAPIAKLQVGRLTGKMVSHYRVLEVIGGGGMGLVYRAEDLKLGRAVALKFLPEEVGDDPKARVRFEREAKAVSALDHPNICSIYEFDEYEGHPFIVMQLLQGKTLRDHLADGRYLLTQPEGLEVAIQIASGLEAAHEKGIIHRDIKPANIFITEKSVAKILDFGVAKVLQLADPSDAVIPSEESAAADEESKDRYGNEDAGIGVLRLAAQNQDGSVSMTNEEGAAPSLAMTDRKVAPPNTTLTRTGMKLGTAGYMSPEQVRGEPLDARTDIFSFGLVLYEMATGERAFTGETEAIVHDAIVNREPRPVRELAPEITPSLEEVIGRCLEKEPSQRYESVAELTDALARERVQVPLVAPGSSPEQHKASHPRRRLAVAVLTVLALIALAGVFYRLAHPRFNLTDKDTIVLADFENKTGDPVMGDALTTALRAELEQTPYLNLLASEKINSTLKLLSYDEDQPLTPDIALAICRRTTSRVLITGTIRDFGNLYQLALKATDCNTGEALAESEEQVSKREDIVSTLGRAGTLLRVRLGEPNSYLMNFNKPLETASSASLEALGELAVGNRLRTTKGAAEAIPHLEQAIRLDGNYAFAYQSLGMAQGNEYWAWALKNYQRAYELRERLTERQRRFVEGYYQYRVAGGYDQARQTFLDWVTRYPYDHIPHQYLALVYGAMGDYQSSLHETREAQRGDPDGIREVHELVWGYFDLNRFDEAKTLLEEAIIRGPDVLEFRTDLSAIAFFQNDDDAMRKLTAWARGDSSRVAALQRGRYEAYKGRFALARSECRSGRGASGATADTTAYDLVEQALRDAETGNPRQAQLLVRCAMEFSANRDVKLRSGWALARAGLSAQAEALVPDVEKEYPFPGFIRDYALATLHAAIELNRGNPAAALEALKVTEPYNFGHSPGTLPNLYHVYLRGLAHLQTKQPEQAIRDFQGIVDHKGVVYDFIIGALAHLQLARAQVMAGDKDAARKSYQDFLILWKDADPDIPIYRQAKAEYAKLK